MVPREHARRFDDDGFFILEGAVAPSDLEVLRGECGRLVDERTGRWIGLASTRWTSTIAAAATSSTPMTRARPSASSCSQTLSLIHI